MSTSAGAETSDSGKPYSAKVVINSSEAECRIKESRNKSTGHGVYVEASKRRCWESSIEDHHHVAYEVVKSSREWARMTSGSSSDGMRSPEKVPSPNDLHSVSNVS